MRTKYVEGTSFTCSGTEQESPQAESPSRAVPNLGKSCLACAPASTRNDEDAALSNLK